MNRGFIKINYWSGQHSKHFPIHVAVYEIETIEETVSVSVNTEITLRSGTQVRVKETVEEIFKQIYEVGTFKS